MKTAAGRIVHVLGPTDNGAPFQPGVITRDWSNGADTTRHPACVNVTVFPDGVPAPRCYKQITLYHTRAAAEAAMAAGEPGHAAAFWPERV